MKAFPKSSRIDNVFSSSEINSIIEYFKDQPMAHYFAPQKTINKNLDYHVEGSFINKTVRPKISKILNDDNHEFFGGAYKEYELPYQPHIDNVAPSASMTFRKDRKHETAFLIPLMEGSGLSTAMFNVFLPVGHTFSTHTTDKERVVEIQPYLTKEKSAINMEEFDHVDEPIKSLMPYIPVDSIQPWKLGSVITWHFDQLHCSTNFHKHGIIKKFLVIMVN